jgi:hypothetical protein
MTKWKQVPAERYDDMLCMLPPAFHGPDHFLVGEPMDHRGPKGQPRFTGFVRINGAVYETTEPIGEIRDVGGPTGV